MCTFLDLWHDSNDSQSPNNSHNSECCEGNSGINLLSKVGGYVERERVLAARGHQCPAHTDFSSHVKLNSPSSIRIMKIVVLFKNYN